jgi:hypothetical protein
MEDTTHLIHVMRYVMNGSGLKDIRCCDSGITRYSAIWKVFWRPSEMPFLPLTLTLSPKGRGKITFDNTFKKGKEENYGCTEKN